MTSTDRYLSALRGRRQVSSAVLEDALSAINLHFKHQGINIPSGKTKTYSGCVVLSSKFCGLPCFRAILANEEIFSGKRCYNFSLNLSRVSFNIRILSLLVVI